MITIEMAMFTASYIQPCFPSNPPLSFPGTAQITTFNTVKTKATAKQIGLQKFRTAVVANDSFSFASSPFNGYFNQTSSGQSLSDSQDKRNGVCHKRVFFLDVNPLCYEGSTPSLRSFGRWMSLFFGEVSHRDPVIAVLDGENGIEHRRQLLPSYKAHRRKFLRRLSSPQRFSRSHVGKSHQVIAEVLRKCNVPDSDGKIWTLTLNQQGLFTHQVIKVDGYEADDVVATLAGQVLSRGFRVVIASPDKDFKQLISEDVQIVMPLPDLRRWSFYTLRHYKVQYNCDPESDLSLRCIVGDEVDGVPGIQHVAPDFGRKTALKLIKKHGTLETLLNAAAVRTVGKPYVQDALTKYAYYLRRNYEVLALKRDVDVQLHEEWLVERETCNDKTTLSTLFKYLEETKESNLNCGRSDFSYSEP